MRRIGDTAVALLKAGAATDKKDNDGMLAVDLAPDTQVNHPPSPKTQAVPSCSHYTL
ncbi:hypothetical protein BJ875DRAFT_448158, partial [Amylocarpus encephaloides]